MTLDSCCTPHLHHILCSAHTRTPAQPHVVTRHSLRTATARASRERRESRHRTLRSCLCQKHVCDALCFHVRRSVTSPCRTQHVRLLLCLPHRLFSPSIPPCLLVRRSWRHMELRWHQVFAYLTLEFLWIVFPTITALSESKTLDSVMSVPIRPVYRPAFQDPWQRSQGLSLPTCSTTRRRRWEFDGSKGQFLLTVLLGIRRKFHGNHGVQERDPDLKRTAYQKLSSGMMSCQLSFGYHWLDVAHVHYHSPLSVALRIRIPSPTRCWRSLIY